jgi:DNA adenine methylase
MEHPLSKPIIPWIGGKRRLAKTILPLFPEHRTYIEPFCGAAALFFMKDPAPVEVINDINGELMNLYRVVKYHLDGLVQEFRWELVGRLQFEWHLHQPAEQLTDIQRAARFYYLQKTCFGGKVQGQNFGVDAGRPPRLHQLRMEEDLSAAHQRLVSATIEHLPWTDCVARYDRPESLFYCDPPYWKTEGYGVNFGFENYDRLAQIALSIKGKMVISVNDIPEMRKVFKGLRMQRTDIRYTVGGSDRAARTGELSITNF